MIPAIEVPAAAAASSPAQPATSGGGGCSSGCGGGGVASSLGGGTSASVSNLLREQQQQQREEEDQEGELLFEGDELTDGRRCASKMGCHGAALADQACNLPRLFEKSVIIHRDENGFGLRLKGQAPVFVEHVHKDGAAWRAGVRRFDRMSKVNGTTIANMDHKDVVLMFKSCTRFVGLTLLSPMGSAEDLALSPKSAKQQRANLQALGLVPTTSVPASISFGPFTTGYNQKLFARQYPIGGGGGGGGGGTGTRRAFYRAASQSLIGSIPLPLNASSSSANNKSGHSSQLQCKDEDQVGCSSELGAGKRAAVCINCRTSIKSANHPGASPTAAGSTCSQCQLAFGRHHERHHHHHHHHQQQQQQQQPQQQQQQQQQQLTEHHQRKFDNIRKAEFSKQQQMIAEHQQRQRSYGSLKDQRQQQLDQQNEVAQQERQQKLEQQQQQRLVERQPPPHAHKLSQSNSTSSLPAVATSGLPRQPTTNKRLEIIREFIDTEMTHTERLRCLDELFYRPLKSGGFMTSEQLRMVFSCHRTMYKIHRQIYRILLSANYNSYTTEPMIGSALLEIFEGDLKRRLERAACSFCVAQSANVDLLNKLTRRDTKVGEFLAQVTSQQMVGRLGIKDLLASCFQRLTKYPLLLENLLKATPLPEPVEPRKVASQRATGPPTLASSNEFKEEEEEEAEQVAQQDEEGEEEEVENEFEDEEEMEKVRNTRRMLAISLAEEREFIERALLQSRQILVRVNESVKVAVSHNKLKEIWKRTDKYPGVPLIDITKEQVVHEGLLTLRLSKRSFDVYVLLLNNYIIILTRESQDKYRLKFFTPEGKSSSNNSQSVYSPVFVIDEHLTTRDAATDENGFYLLCKRKDDSRIYEFASRSPAERVKWRDRIQWTIERQMSKSNRRPSCESSITKSSSEISRQETEDQADDIPNRSPANSWLAKGSESDSAKPTTSTSEKQLQPSTVSGSSNPPTQAGRPSSSSEPTKIEGTISYVEDDGIVMPSKMESSWALVEQAIQVNIFDSLRKPVPSN